MNRPSFVLSAAVLALLLPAVRAADEPLPNGGALMDHYVEVTGGKAAYEKRRSEIMEIQMEFLGRGIKGTLTRYTEASNNAYSTGEIEGVGKIEEGVFNGQAWENSAMMGPRLKEGAENADAVRDSMFNLSLNWSKIFKAETVGLEKLNDEDCYKVLLTPIGEGKPQTMYLSKKTGYVVRVLRTTISPMGEIPVEALPSEYKTFEGILYPTKILQKVMGNDMLLTMLSLKANTEIPKERFEPPAEIKKLMAK